MRAACIAVWCLRPQAGLTTCCGMLLRGQALAHGGIGMWVRVVMYEGGRTQPTTKQLAALQVAVFGARPVRNDFPAAGARWDSIYLVGSIPSRDSWPPSPRLYPPEAMSVAVASDRLALRQWSLLYRVD